MDAGSDWNEVFLDLANADGADLREVGRTFADTSMTESAEAAPFQERALSICSNGGFEAAATGD